MNREVTFQLICKAAAQSGTAAREGLKHTGKRLLQHQSGGFSTEHFPIECLFGPDCIPDDTWGASDPREGFGMQLTSPASCKKYLKSQ